MCIEKEIAANTAAINSLTAAVRQLLDALPSRLTGADSRSVIVDEVQRDLRARASAAGLSAGEVNLLAAAPAPVSPAPAPVNPAPAPVAPAPAPVNPAPAPASMPPVNPVPAAAAPVVSAPASMPPVNPVPAAAAPVVSAPASMPPVNPVPAASAPAQDGMWYPGGGEVPETPLTLADVRSVCVRAGQAGYTQAVVDFLAGNGVKLLTELPPAQYPALLMMLAEKGVR